MKKKNLLNKVCPFKVLDKETTWEQLIQELLGAVTFTGFCLMFFVVADLVEVIK